MAMVLLLGDFSQTLDASILNDPNCRLISDIRSLQLEATANKAADAKKLLCVTEKCLKANASFFRDSHPALKNCEVLALYEESTPIDALLWLKEFPLVNHIGGLNSAGVKSQIAASLAQSKICWGQEFLSIAMGSPQPMLLRRTDELKQAYASIESYVGDLKCFPEFGSLVTTVVYELLSNAFYNAKRDSKTHKPVVSDRTIEFTLGENEWVKFEYGQQDGYIWIQVEDSFGTLDKETLVRALERAARERAPDFLNPGGAGLGLLMIYGWATEVNFSIHRGVSTKISCKLRLTTRMRLFDAEPSAVNIFQVDS